MTFRSSGAGSSPRCAPSPRSGSWARRRPSRKRSSWPGRCALTWSCSTCGSSDGDGLELIGRLTADDDGPSVLVLTAIEKLDTMRDAAAAGARGYLTKRVGPRELRDAIVTVFGGGTVFESSAGEDASRGDARLSPVEAPASRPLLTTRERQVLALVARGQTDREAAERLSLSVRTVQNHLAAVRRKTGLRRRSELASWAVRHALD